MIVIRSATDEDIDGLCELFRVCFSKLISVEEWLWKYKDAPHGAHSYVGVDGRLLVSHFGGIRCAMELEGYSLWAYQFCDVMTHPAYRARTFSLRPPVMRAAETFYRQQEMDFAFGFPSERHARLHCLVMGASRRMLTLYQKRLTIQDVNIHKMPLRVYTRWDGIRDKELDVLWQKCRGLYPLSIVKDARYLRWRYQQHPTRKYQIVAWRGFFATGIKALAVVSIVKDRMNLLDFMVPNNSTIDAFLDLLDTLAVGQNVSTIDVWLNGEEPVVRHFLAHGYEVSQGLPCALKLVKSGVMDIDSFYSKFCYRMGDYDDS
ncbi:MAG: GNAT family N-acetyltransferase [Nitrospirae bacterium]|nr:GNAT family N-acetyltransferase [Nitrospirota bacterium]MBF0590725.1 GNAT family N-acetyltransferase [Nitrospirota bacterium]